MNVFKKIEKMNRGQLLQICKITNIKASKKHTKAQLITKLLKPLGRKYMMRLTTKPIIISGFMGIGKSTFAKDFKNTLDLDSAGFSWCPGDPASDERVQKLIEKHSSCDKTLTERIRNPNATSDYVNAIEDAMKTGGYDYIFVSTHESTRKWLHENNIPFILVYPAENRKDEWIKNLTKRGTPGLAKFLQSNWNTGMNLIGGLQKDKFHTKEIIMESPKFLSDYAENLNY